MALDVAQFLRETFVTSLEEVVPKLPDTRLSNLFRQIEERIIDDNVKSIWCSSETASTPFLPYLYDLNDAVADCRIFAEQCHEATGNFRLNPFHQTNFVRKMQKELERIKKDLTRLKKEMLESSRNLSSQTMNIFPKGRHTSLKSHAWFKHEMEIETLLSERGYEAIGVYGISGSGKSSLVQKVLNSPNVCKEFSPIIWVCLSDMHSGDDADFESNIVKYILCELNCDVDKWIKTNPSNMELLDHLKTLLMSKRYLIVFDDVWQKHDFYSNLGHTSAGADIVGNHLSYALPKDGGAKIIVTSRLKEVAQDVVGERNLIDLNPLTIVSAGSRISFESATSQVVKFGEQVKEIEKALLSDEGYKAIGVYGMSGSGKTALVQEVLKSPSVYNVFSPIVWVCLSDIHSGEDADFEINIVKYILCELKCDVDKWTNTNPSIEELLQNLKNLLVSRKYLIVLDDVWQKHNFYSNLGNELPGASPVGNHLTSALPTNAGGKIIITSGLKEVVQNMTGEKNLIQLKPLDRHRCRLILDAEIGFRYAKDIKDLLIGDGFKTIGIYGPSANANTSLVHKVLNSRSVLETFQPIVWVPVSQISSGEELDDGVKIVQYMFKKLGHGDELAGYDQLLKNVYGLLKSKKYLIVLADVWHNNCNNWYNDFLVRALPKDGDGVIIVISQRKEVVQDMDGVTNLIHVRLSELESNETADLRIGVKYVMDEIADRCHGLPLAAMTLAKIIIVSTEN